MRTPCGQQTVPPRPENRRLHIVRELEGISNLLWQLRNRAFCIRSIAGEQSYPKYSEQYNEQQMYMLMAEPEYPGL